MDRDMFDTMTMVKTIGALCGALLVFMLGSWFSSAIYGGGEGHGHEGEHAQGYHIEVASAEGEAAEAAPVVDFAEVLASADAGKGERVFKKCASCHSLAPGENKVGPSLAGVVGRNVQAIGDFGYSGALIAAADVWTPDNLNHFLEKPKAFAAGTTMGFNGLSKVEDRANLVAYLSQQPG